jgi:hypothetical protein
MSNHRNLSDLLDRNRQTGSTTALLEIAKGNECTIITHTENYANQVKRLLTTRHNNVTVMSLSSLRWHGMIPQTVLIDTSAIYWLSAEHSSLESAYNESLSKNNHLRYEIFDLKDELKLARMANKEIREILNGNRKDKYLRNRKRVRNSIASDTRLN